MLIKHLSRYSHIVFFLNIICATSITFDSASPSQDSVNFPEISKYAYLSMVAYQSVPSIKKFSSLRNYNISHHSNIPGYEISYFIATNHIKKTQVIVVRGTSNIENAFLNMEVKLITDNHAGIRLHNGFSQFAQAIYAEITPTLKKDYTVSTTGHSLGGAVALIVAMHLDVDKFNIGEVVTFGQPKVTNIEGANTFQHLRITRVVMPKDLVPLVPPFDYVDLNNPGIYWHAGKEIILLDSNTYAITEGIKSMMRAFKFTQEPLSDKNIHNHNISLYITTLATKIPSATLVPFKSNFNLFNLFN